MKHHWFAIFFFLTSVALPQWLSPPYSAEFVHPPRNLIQDDFSSYFQEYDIDNDGELEILTFDSYSIRFFEKDFSIIDAINVERTDDKFLYGYTNIKLKNKNYILLKVSGNHRGEVWLVNIREDQSVYKKILYKFYSGNNFPSFTVNYSPINDSLSLLYIAVDYPKKHDYKRIIALNPNDLNIEWVKYTAYYIADIFVNENKQDYFYFTTFAWFNRVYFSNNTYYNTEDESNKIFIDTAFTNKVYPLPDENAPDYSCDSASYLVKMDLNGNIIYRKRAGSRFQHLRLIDNSNNDFALLYLLDRFHSKNKLLRFNKSSEELTSLNYKNIKLISDILIKRRGNKYYSSSPGKLQYFDIRGDSAILTKEYQFENNLVGNFIGKYFVGRTADGEYKIYDDKINYLASINNVKDGITFIWSDVFNSLLAKTTNSTHIVKLTKLSLFQRITTETMRYINYAAIAIIFILLLFWIITMRISKQKIVKQNEQLIKQQQELEMATSQLIRSEKLATLGTVAAGFAHQLNSPIGAILNSAQRLSKKYQDENIDLILRSVNFCKSIVGKFLIASRPDAEDKSTCSDFNCVWNDWFELYKSEFLNRKIQVYTQLENSDVKIDIKNSELMEILNNTLFNARDSVLEANRKDKYIKITTNAEDNKFKIIIEDSGTGFDEKVIDSIFEPFVTTKPIGAGTGLGMWITKKIIDEHRGGIKVRNGDIGAIIEIVLPIC